MGQLHTSQDHIAQGLQTDIDTESAFLEALYSNTAPMNVVVEIQGFSNSPYEHNTKEDPDLGWLTQGKRQKGPLSEAEQNRLLLLRITSRKLFWRHSDQLLPDAFFEARLADRSNVESSINFDANAAEGGVTNVGAVEIYDQDRYFMHYVNSYNFRGRPVRFLLGPHKAPRKDYREIIRAYVDDITRSTDGKIKISLRDNRFRIDESILRAEFDGRGLQNGSPDLVGVKRPYCIGYVPHCEPPVCDTPTGLRMINNGPIQGVRNGFYGGHPAVNAGDFPEILDLLNAKRS